MMKNKDPRRSQAHPLAAPAALLLLGPLAAVVLLAVRWWFGW